jgi:hypothetical protein
MFRLIDAFSGLEKEVHTLKRNLTAYEEANTELQKAREAAEAREDATEGKLRWNARPTKVWFSNHSVSFRINSRGVEVAPCWQMWRLDLPRRSRP